jgi:hypothetical protein
MDGWKLVLFVSEVLWGEFISVSLKEMSLERNPACTYYETN